ncbi:MAG: hypothetical protein K0S45_815 [Nitrospira sp.]|jgi:hypothetical protein|nr:hypothetical protein [Nitrospira sp.]
MHPLKQRGTRASLSMCTCGKLHLSYDLITLHFEQDEFISFADSVAHLLAQYKKVHSAPQPSSIPSVHNGICH